MQKLSIKRTELQTASASRRQRGLHRGVVDIVAVLSPGDSHLTRCQVCKDEISNVQVLADNVVTEPLNQLPSLRDLVAHKERKHRRGLCCVLRHRHDGQM